jgi:hypothetical protein
MTPEPMHESIPETEPIAPNNFFSRLGGIYFSPGSTFKEIGGSPRVLAPIIAIIVISLLAGYYLTKKVDIQSMFENQMQMQASRVQLTPEQEELQAQRMSMIAKAIGVMLPIGMVFQGLALPLIVAAVFKLISTLMGAENKFKGVFTVTIYSMLAVSIVSYALLVLIISFKDTSDLTLTNMGSVVSSNLGAVLTGMLGKDALPIFVAKLAAYIDVFVIWQIALLAIGYSAVSRKLKTSTVAIWLSSLYGVIAVIGSFISSLRS